MNHSAIGTRFDIGASVVFFLGGGTACDGMFDVFAAPKPEMASSVIYFLSAGAPWGDFSLISRGSLIAALIVSFFSAGNVDTDWTPKKEKDDDDCS